MSQLTLLHISDLHFGGPYVEEVGESLLQLAKNLRLDAIVVSGDLTHRAKASEFRAASEFLVRLPPAPRLVIPGNHDVPLDRPWQRLTDPLRLYREHICQELNPVLRIPGAVLAGVDSTSPRRAVSGGRVDAWQLDRCEQAFLEADASDARIVVAHHHFAPAHDKLRDWSMPKAKRAMMRFVELRVDLVLGGHLHRAYIGNSLDFYPGTHRERGVIIAQCGTTTSRKGRGKEREKNSFNLVEMDQLTIAITHYIYFDAAEGFVPNSRHLFARGLNRLDVPSDPSTRASRLPLQNGAVAPQ